MLTLIEAAKMSDDPIQAAIIEMFAESSDILQALPFDTVSGGGLRYNREETLPGIGFRGVNEAYDESVGVLNPVFDPLVIAGGDLDVDNFILATRGEDARAVHEKMKVKALTLKIAQAFIKGDQAAEPRSFDGLQVRLTGTQLIDNGSSSGGDVLSLAKLDELIDAVDSPTHLIMNRGLRRALTQGARDSSIGGFITYGVDAFGRKVTQYNDLPILISDQDNTGAEILPFTESAASGTAQCSSVYCVSFREMMLTGIQNGTMDVRDLGELHSKPAKRTRVEWFMGIALQHPRAAARLRYVKAGKAAA